MFSNKNWLGRFFFNYPKKCCITFYFIYAKNQSKLVIILKSLSITLIVLVLLKIYKIPSSVGWHVLIQETYGKKAMPIGS